MNKKTLFLLMMVFGLGQLPANTEPNLLDRLYNLFSSTPQKKLVYNKYECSPAEIMTTATIEAINNGSWQETSTWSTGVIPSINDDVLIPTGITVNLVGVAKAKTITVNGILKGISGQVNNAEIDLETEWLLVSGSGAQLEIGTELQPYVASGNCKITLIGSDDGDNIGNMGDKFIAAMNGATIELHGEEKISWTHLGANATVGSNQITLSEPVDWEVGNDILIVSSRTNWNEAEKRTISAISTDKLTIYFTEALNHPHFSAIKTYTRAIDNKTWTADLRAEVGLLSHNIKIQGDAASESTGFGGHIMAMTNSTLKASGIELYRMGQKAKLGRYPWHWHLLHTFGTGQYLKNSSIHKSFNRAVTIHGTSYTTVDNNFMYDHIGHGVFLEDGSERYNMIKNNVALLTKKPKKGEELTPSDNQFNQVQDRTPATYWITNPNNIIENNVAAGTEGTGYWFAFPQKPMGASANDSRFNGIEPYKEPLGLFKGNKTHSSVSGVDVFDQLTPNHAILSNRGWKNSEEHVFENCTWYSNNLGIYTGLGNSVGQRLAFTSNLIFKNNIMIDNPTAIQFASYSQVVESAVVANSGTGIFQGKAKLYRMYDGAGQIRDSHFVGWNNINATFLSSGGAATKNTNHRFSGITTDNNGVPHINLPNYDIKIKNNDTRPQNPSHPRNWNTVVLDEDGSLTGRANSSIVSNHPFMLVGDEFQHSNWTRAFRSPHNFVLSALRFPGLPTSNIPNVTCRRTKTGTPTASSYHIYGFKTFIQFPFIVNEDFQYTYTFESLPSNKKMNVAMENAAEGDSYIIKFTDFGKLGGLSLKLAGSPITESASLSSLKNNNGTNFYLENNGDLYIKYVATQFNQNINMKWNTNFTVPILDTDNDLVSDRQEIENGTDPFDDDGEILRTQDFIATSDVRLFPNPASHSLHFSGRYFNTETTVQIYDLVGKMVLQNQFSTNDSPNKSLNISKLPKGLYMVVMTNNNGKSTKKIAIE
ncbi:G8 domain-containing protein [Tamlana crocina]|uniref:T9SS type A sorting domain-containing protein n=1 Tax=Tamlana crocina TaxID=393006 RepID=A0ABX1D7U0_9FLAO|nr:G8 domain-containing protein [Tamlana crocina]NJX14438.1 T9SS type A sorting domain-containing protein [Tamlana crocina]